MKNLNDFINNQNVSNVTNNTNVNNMYFFNFLIPFYKLKTTSFLTILKKQIFNCYRHKNYIIIKNKN